MRELLLIAGAGALGSLGRYGVSEWAKRAFGEGFPVGTLMVNAVGSILLGLIAGLAIGGAISREAKLAIGVGFCGAFTTFSTFSVETLSLAQDGKLGRAAANVGLSLVLGLLGAWLGLWVARTQLRSS